MGSSKGSSKRIDPEVRVRSNTGVAAFTGALLTVIGFFWFGGPLEADVGLLATGKTMFHLVLRVGGILMIIIAVWCSIGVPIALLMHAIMANVIGVLLITSAVLMLSGDGFFVGNLLAIVCGIILITKGLRDFQDFRKLPVEEDRPEQTEEVEDAPAFDEPIGESPLIDPMHVTTSGHSAKKRRPPGPAGSTPDGFLSGLSEKERRTRR